MNLYDSGARFQANTGAFLSADPMAEKYYGISPYAYCAGNPVNLVDPEGKKVQIFYTENGKTYSSFSLGKRQISQIIVLLKVLLKPTITTRIIGKKPAMMDKNQPHVLWREVKRLKL